MKRKKVLAFMAAMVLGVGSIGSVPVYAKSIWDLPGAPERPEGSDEDVEEYFANLEELETARERITEEDTLTEEAQNDLLANGPGSVYARASGDTGGTWEKVGPEKWKYKLSNGSYAVSQWVKHPATHVDPETGEEVTRSYWYYLDENGFMKSGLFWADGSAYYCNGAGEMQTGWQDLGGEYEWYYFDANGAWLVTSDIEGCSHGVLCVGSNHYHMPSMNIKYYNLAGTEYNSKITQGANAWNSATDVVQISEGNESNSNVTIQKYSYVGRVIIETLVGDWGDYKEFDNVTKDWGYASMGININKTQYSRDFTHEFGHAFGLTHHKDSRYGYRYSIMYPDSLSAMKIQIYDVNALGHIRDY